MLFKDALLLNPNIIRLSPVETRLAKARDEQTPQDVLQILSEDPFWYVRYFVALNKNAPKDCLDALSRDLDFRVAEQAKYTVSTSSQHPSIDTRISLASISNRSKKGSNIVLKQDKNFEPSL